MTTRLRLICHAATPAVRAAAFPDDEPLEPRVIERLASRPPTSVRADRCWTSPAVRARDTATALGFDADIEPALRECDYGRWTGLALEAVQAEEPDALGLWLRDPAAAPHGGESVLQMMARVGEWLDGRNGEAGHLVAVTHASVIRAAVLHAIGAPPHAFWRIDIAPLSVVKLTGHQGRWTLAGIGPLSERKLTSA